VASLGSGAGESKWCHHAEEDVEGPVPSSKLT